MKEIKIEKIVLRIGNKEIELSLDEAQSLKNELDELFGKYYYTPYPITYPSPITYSICNWGANTYSNISEWGLRTTTT